VLRVAGSAAQGRRLSNVLNLPRARLGGDGLMPRGKCTRRRGRCIDPDLEAAMTLVAEGHGIDDIAELIDWPAMTFRRRIWSYGFDERSLCEEYRLRGGRLPPVLRAPEDISCRCCGRRIQQMADTTKAVCNVCIDVDVAMVA